MAFHRRPKFKPSIIQLSAAGYLVPKPNPDIFAANPCIEDLTFLQTLTIYLVAKLNPRNNTNC